MAVVACERRTGSEGFGTLEPPGTAEDRPLSPQLFHQAALLSAGPLIIAAMLSDVRSRRIPHWIVLSLLVVGLVGARIGGGWWGLGEGLLALVLGFGLLLPLYCLGAMGAGDVKLLAVMGLWLGVRGTLWAFALAALVGLLPALVSVVRSKSASPALAHLWVVLAKFSGRRLEAADLVAVDGEVSHKTFPYGVCLGAAGLAVLSSRVFTNLGV